MSNKMDRPLVTVDGRTLMDRPLEPPNFVVDTLISQGLHILAGSPKVGKSWLALWLAVTVAKGEPVWGMSVKQGTTLYLCLEDSVLRIQNRLFEITEDAPDSVHFCTECAPIGQGLEEQVEGFLVAHPDTVLVLVDTLQMVRPVHDATYANDYRDLSVLKRLADKHGIAILLIHHLRKETADDVFNRNQPCVVLTDCPCYALIGKGQRRVSIVNDKHSFKVCVRFHQPGLNGIAQTVLGGLIDDIERLKCLHTG